MSSEDPETAQARLFLIELEHHARLLTRRRAAAGAEAQQPLTAELAYVNQQIDKIVRRFPELGSPER